MMYCILITKTGELVIKDATEFANSAAAYLDLYLEHNNKGLLTLKQTV